MTIEVTLQIEPLDYENTACEALFDTFSDFSFATSNGISLVTIFTDTDPTAESIDAVRSLRAAGITVLNVFEDLVNTIEVAERAGVTPQTARQWTDRADFPTPNAHTVTDDSQRVWSWAHVQRWLSNVKAYPQDENLPDNETVTAVNVFIRGADDLR